MSFKCSIFGHKYGDSEVEREREEDGSEVVITVRETESCVRCGETRVVSENKEVTTLETAADIVAEDLEDADESDERAGDERHADDGSTSVAGTDQEPVDAPGSGTQSDHAGQPDGPPAQSSSHGSGESSIPEAEPGSSVDTQTDASEDDGVILDEEEPDDDREPGEWPEEPEEDEDDWQPETEIDPQPETERPGVESTGNAVTVPDGDFHCPECGFTTAVESSSLREGDFCPDCHQGALEHKSEES